MKTILQSSFILGFCLIAFLLTFPDHHAYGQCTTGCTTSVTAPSSTGLSAGGNNQTLCLQGTGAYTGNIDFNDRNNIVLCIGPGVTIGTGVNFQEIDKNITVNNYGTVSTNLNINTSNGRTFTFNNYGTLGGGFSIGTEGVLNNKSGGQINGNTANFNGGTFNNEAGAVFTRSGSFSISNTINNQGSFTSGALTVNSGGSVTLAGTTNTINGNLTVNGSLTVTSTPTITGNVQINGGGTVTGTGAGTCNTLCPTGTITNNGTLTSIYLCKSASGSSGNAGALSGGTVASTTVCSGSNVPLTVAGFRGTSGTAVASILRWESSADAGFSSPVTISSSGSVSSITVNNVTATTYYRAVINGGSCSNLYSSVSTVTVSPGSVGGTIAGGAAYCSTTNSGTLTLSGHVGSVLRWESAANPGFSSATNINNTTTSQPYNNVTTTTYYRARVQNGSCAALYSDPVAVTINAGPTISSSLTGSACGGNIYSYTTTSATAGATFTWSRAAVAGISNAARSGSGPGIIETLVNTTSAPVNVTYVLTPSANGCAGTSSNLIVSVVPPNSITTAALSSSTLCVGSTNNISFTASCGFDADNQFTAQLSNASGSFANPVNIGSLAGAASGTIAVTIPNGIVAAGTGYRIRVVSSAPVIVGSDNGTNLTVQVYSALPLASQSFITAGTTAGSTLTASGSNITSYQWGYYTTLGGTITNLAGRTNSTYTPQGSHFPTAGTYHVVCKMNTSGAGCGMAVSNAVTVYVNCPETSNLITNGNFSSGNSGFTSQYNYVANSADANVRDEMYSEGTYHVGPNPYEVHNLFCNMSTSSDSPVSGGNMLIGNASTGGSRNLWVQTVPVTANTDYVLTFWAVSLADPVSSLQFGIYAGCFRTGADIEVMQAGIPTCTWTKFTVQLNSGSQTSVDLAIRNISVTAGGNDIAIDDIVLYACSAGSSNFSTSNTFVWRGFNSDWASTDNWGTSCALPSCGDAVTIPVLPAGKVYPVITTSTATASTVNVSNGAVLSINAGGNLTICGDFTNNGSLTTASNGTITFSNGKTPRTPQVLTGNLSGWNMLGNLTINNTTPTDIVRLANGVELTGNLTITSGVLDANGRQIKMAGNFTNAGTFTPNGNMVEFRGANAQQISQTGTGQFYDLKINKSTASGTLTFNPALTTVSNQLTLTRGLAVTPGTNEIYVSSSQTTAVTGHDTPGDTYSDSYVFGRLRRAVAGARPFEFPVGAANKYEFIMINVNNALVGTSYVTAYFNSANAATQPSVTESDVNYTEACSGGYWTLNPDAEPTAGLYGIEIVPIGFSCTGPSQSLLKRPTPSAGNPNPAWNNGSGSMGAPSRPGGIRRGGLSSFSEIIIASGSTAPLPVRLISFSGQLQGQQVELNWITASEKNNAYFQVERSRDGLHFEPIGLLDGKGTTQTRQSYAFMDTEPLPGIGYYRLRQVDSNGDFEFSKTIAMKVSSDDQVNLFPNPAQRGQLVKLRITTQEAANYELIVTDQQGRIMLQERFDLPEGEKELSLPGSDQFPAGLYVIKAFSTELFSLSPYQGKLIVR